uniref:NADH-ubiquinone oxidoreductase chain 2 n=1 Tax=Pseudolestes mirabilis TaxID=476809 RepID=D2DNH5_9ODON|nr:NADH dehydrogenase subunit 2 [Pseudolestes mirabilis]ACM63334.1 NADH dehydrogenase subunit 2 [Pseudolestes mirabilis]
MTLNISTALFTSTLITGTMITITSSSWIIMWIGLEMNLLSFIPMMNKHSTPQESEASMKYFLIQAMASILLLTGVLLSDMMQPETKTTTIILLALFMKTGASPFHFWFPSVMQGVSWTNCIILMTWQKVAPMIMMSYQLTNGAITNLVVIASVMVGAIGGVNQTSIRKMMAYSSISHVGWMITSMLISKTHWMTYFTMYSILNVTVILIMHQYSIQHLMQMFSMKLDSTVKFTMWTSMLSLAGLPPFLGFLPKWIIIQNLIMLKEFHMVIIMVMMTLITLFFYLRMMYSAFTLNTTGMYWKNTKQNKLMTMLTMSTSLTGIPMISLLNIY